MLVTYGLRNRSFFHHDSWPMQSHPGGSLDIVMEMFSRRSVLIAPAAAMATVHSTMQLCMHQTTSAAAGYRRSLEGYAKAGIKYVEIIPPQFEEFIKKEGVPAAKRLLSDLGLNAVSSG